MADDLDDDWWMKDAVGESDSEKEESKPKKKGVKRAASPEDSGDEDVVPPKSKALKKSSAQTESPKSKSKAGKVSAKKAKKKKKNGRGKFVRKKITAEDEDDLNKPAATEDVQDLLDRCLAVIRSDDSDCEPESDTEEGKQLSLDIETDFFPANEGQESGAYLGQVLPGWQQVVGGAKLPPASPLLLILCSSAVRAVQLNREIKSFLGKQCKTAKLFSKHMKLEEQKKFLQKNVCHACIGTPQRVQVLLEAGSLKTSRLLAVVLDWNWRDVKLKRLADIPDILRELALLFHFSLLSRLRDRRVPCKIAIL